MAQNTQPEPKTLDAAFEVVLQELLETFLKKHRDYGKGNILEIEELGIAFREAEKVSRLKNLLMKSDDPANESIDDTWIDMAVYAVIALLYRRGWFQKLEVEDQPASAQ
ncbi:DUF1599 domain-containing protein [Candidatus Woesebacteria bacterium]|nr:DUF1599 domain-containing protein [Candidatus Woesebacteria bacterium]MCD8507389.1 DUF1599 domain-containing protein [Candidatus Woesebacteria bacterium]MCD8527026.1 DUF1599 domain-containing protein [Candidatus Woesebacteria bacterium]MCD8545910.1 DUF1599 domain-containing protein [Candidatus Woesebacteria bacterium]